LYVLCAGVLLFQVAGEVEPVNDDTRVMEIFISGDACISIYTHLCPSDNTRPMALDILWQVRRCAERLLRWETYAFVRGTVAVDHAAS
jgi:hypothetical protein